MDLKAHKCQVKGCDRFAVCSYEDVDDSAFKVTYDYYCAGHDPRRNRLLKQIEENEARVKALKKENAKMWEDIEQMDKRVSPFEVRDG